MIPAWEALRLESAKLTDEERAKADALEKEIEEYVLAEMKYHGCQYEGQETDPNVLAEINQRLKTAGYTPEWKYLIRKHPLNVAANQVVGFQVMLTPGDAAYRTALS